jgi:hypothetical protein
VLQSCPARACDSVAPWSRLPAFARHTAAPLPLALFSGAMAAPLLMSPTGTDHALRVLSQRRLGGEPNAESISVWTPLVLPVVLAGVDSVAHAVDACDVARPSSAVLQAVGITFVMVTGLKWVTGRSWPNAGRDPSLPDRLDHPEFARQFHWFSWQNGSAWPSAHTATMAAASTALFTLAHGRSWISYLAIAAATGVAAGMWFGDHHWGSDIVSGGLLGVGVGRSVGLAFREERVSQAAATFAILPWKTAEVQGLRLVAVF